MHQTTAIPQRQMHYRQGKAGKTATSSVVAIATRMTIQLLTNSCKHTCVGLLPGQQPIQCKYNSTACDKLAQIATSAWWHGGALRLKLGQRAGVPAYLNKWRTPGAPPQGGGRPRNQETSPAPFANPIAKGLAVHHILSTRPHLAIPVQHVSSHV